MHIQQRVIRGIGLAALFGALVLAGCATPPPDGKPKTLRGCTDCRLDVTLPPQSRRPEIPPSQRTLRVLGDSHIDIHLESTGDVLLVFSEAAFVDKNNEPLYLVTLQGGSNPLRTLPAGRCPRRGCKYTIVDLDDPNREPLDPWIIIEPY